MTQMKLLEELKKQSSKWIKKQGSQYHNFYWQNGYGAFSVNPTEVDVVVEYIQNQEKHHKKYTFQEEFRAFLKKYKVDYDERYVWDQDINAYAPTELKLVSILTLGVAQCYC